MVTCDNASFNFSSTPIVGSTDSIVWNFAAIPCLEICTGERLTSVEYKIALKICEIIEELDVTTIVLPTCLTSLWSMRLQDPTVLNFFSFIFDTLCSQISTTDGLQSQITNIDPFVTVDLSCCSTNPCVTSGTIKLSEALQSLASCICDQASRITALNTTIQDQQTEINSAIATANAALSTLSTINGTVNTLTSLVNSANTRADTFATAINLIISSPDFATLNAITPVS